MKRKAPRETGGLYRYHPILVPIPCADDRISQQKYGKKCKQHFSAKSRAEVVQATDMAKGTRSIKHPDGRASPRFSGCIRVDK